MDILQLALIGLVVFCGCVIQSAVGFGFALFAVPILVWAGLSLPASVCLSLTCMIFQSSLNCYEYRQHIRWRQTLPLFFLRLVSLPIGIWLMTQLIDFGPSRIKQVIGAFIFCFLVLQWSLRIKPRPHVHPGWTVLAGTSSGLAAGLVGMGGPPIVLWVMAHDWPPRQARSFTWTVFLQLMPINLAILILKFGPPLYQPLLIGLAMTPLGLLGTMLGVRLGAKLSSRRLRWAATLLLVIIALSSLLNPYLRLPVG
ncbi:MAG: sulfite exporter TauE/SafE family protein [Phycisphaeraceae bacterium]|nr:sulfite exporter TauE/SafE family protein [Phycisphaeraceae bacterium]